MFSDITYRACEYSLILNMRWLAFNMGKHVIKYDGQFIWLEMEK